METNTNNRNRWIELVGLFFLVPIFLATPVPNYFKLVVAGLGVVYSIYRIVENKLYQQIFKYERPSQSFIQRMSVIGISLFIIGAIVVYRFDPSMLFSVVVHKPFLWLFILFVYTFLSVVPQELIYRHFFFDRYQFLFDNKSLFLFVNMICFSLCHLFLWDGLVLLLTFIGGGLFAYSYEEEKSMIWVCMEHALYGFIIFTVGMGEMLAFPT